MKTATLRNVTTLRLLVILMLTICGFAGAANAQSKVVGSFTLPYEVHWGNALLPAGAYSITIVSPRSPAVVQSASGAKAIFTMAPILHDSDEHTAYLFITIRGRERRIQSLHLPLLGKSLVYEPLSQSEREMLAKAGQAQIVPVVTAAK